MTPTKLVTILLEIEEHKLARVEEALSMSDTFIWAMGNNKHALKKDRDELTEKVNAFKIALVEGLPDSYPEKFNFRSAVSSVMGYIDRHLSTANATYEALIEALDQQRWSEAEGYAFPLSKEDWTIWKIARGDRSILPPAAPYMSLSTFVSQEVSAAKLFRKGGQ